MRLKTIAVAAFLTLAGAGTANAAGTVSETVIGCTENTCVVWTCVTVGGQTHCSMGTAPRRPGWGPGYPKEP